VIIFGVDAVEGEPGEEAFDNPTSRQEDKALGFVRTFNDGQVPPEIFINPGYEFSGIAAIGPDKFDARKQAIEFGDYHHGAISILNTGSVDDNTEKIAERVDRYMPLATFDFLVCVITARPPFCAVFADWLSMIAAVGTAFFPAFTRTASRNAVLISSHLPLRLQRCQ